MRWGIGRCRFTMGCPPTASSWWEWRRRRTETAQAAAAEIGCDYWTDDYRQLLARPDVDAVDVCVPNHMHAEIVQAAAAAGKHIYCEKPLAMDVAEGKRMVAAAQAAGVITQMTFNFRFVPAVLRAQQLMQEGFLGRIFSFRGRYYRVKLYRPAETAHLAPAQGNCRRRRPVRHRLAHSRPALLACWATLRSGAGDAGHADPPAAGGGGRRRTRARRRRRHCPAAPAHGGRACWGWSKSRAWARA